MRSSEFSDQCQTGIQSEKEFTASGKSGYEKYLLHTSLFTVLWQWMWFPGSKPIFISAKWTCFNPTKVVFDSGNLYFWTSSFWFRPCWTLQSTSWIKLFPSHRFTSKNLLLFKTCLMLPCVPYIYALAFLFLPSLDVKGRNVQSSQFHRFASVPGFQFGT